MTPETSGIALLQAVEQTLSRDLAPTLSGDARFKTLMAASAVRMVIRELDQAGALVAAEVALLNGSPASDLARAIRAGAHDRDPGVHDALLAQARARTAVSRG
ncbi:MAG: DUF6285 domain-containing protein [Hyphomicrobiales bacterium]|nr:DUF6285 domain-containing protein [Hyphomicrobiales bacterium]